MTESDASLFLSALAVLATIALAIWKSRTDRDFREWQKSTTEEAVAAQLRSLEIEEARFLRELATEGRERVELASESVPAGFTVDCAWRDSAQTWARLIARNDGPGVARNVKLDVWFESGSTRVETDRMSGMDRGESNYLQPGEAVHIAFVFSLASPPAEDLRYRLTWDDDDGPHEVERQVSFF